jgi:hypothetical protein
LAPSGDLLQGLDAHNVFAAARCKIRHLALGSHVAWTI